MDANRLITWLFSLWEVKFKADGSYSVGKPCPECHAEFMGLLNPIIKVNNDMGLGIELGKLVEAYETECDKRIVQEAKRKDKLGFAPLSRKGNNSLAIHF
jgi:hypothetical protein